ncbi:vitamin B12-dependent ribonucleotide reductase [Mycoplasmoides pirum]|uniref:vitamin B12-dependent ribonucleotide reductase n=1 Tax=Mycoplasmoides pirum TaxID=2122 RepID=UPI00055D3177|nr:vitamin B12-dependent ribonucleotide reductase [Mycoplasmoides pirum]
MQHNYSLDTINSLNHDIKQFNNIFPIKETYNKSLSGISRLVMLDRYAQKDKLLKTLKVGDLVIVLINEDQFFSAHGIGTVLEINKDDVKIQLEEQEFGKISPTENTEDSKLGIIIRKKDKIEKPLELFFEQIAHRVAKALASVEKKRSKRIEFEEKFYQEISNFNFIPAGRILFGAGSSSKVTYFNCFVMPNPVDSRTGLAKHREKVMEIMSRGGGVGTNGSSLRPKNTVALTVGGHSSGSVSWLNDLSQLTHLVEQGGSRRGAQMIMLNDWHPDIVEFIISKMQNPNILRWILENMKDPLIVEHAKQKLKFTPLSNSEKETHQIIVNNKDNVSVLTYETSLKLLNENGRWEVKNNQFLTGANISVAISDDFMHAVKTKSKWQLRFPDIRSMTQKQKEYYDNHWNEIADVRKWEAMGLPVKVYYEIEAIQLWDLINFCATYSAEPGVFFMDTAQKMTNAQAYGQQIVCTNPCGEQPLAPYSVCNLSAINLANFVDKGSGELKRKELIETVRTAVRMQDNIIDATPYFLDENKQQALGERRVGLGIMGLHDMLIWSNKKYGSKEGNAFIDLVMSIIAETAYRASADLAVEKKPFPFLKKKMFEKFANLPFVKQLPTDIAEKISKKGIRNSHLLTIAPTGSTGTMVGVSTGLEPYFAFEYYRSGRLGQFTKVKQEIVTEWLKYNNKKDKNGQDVWSENNLPDIFVTAMQLSPEEHANTQITIQKWIDSSISKTVNAPKGYSVKQVEKIYEMLYEGNAKGGTVYVDGSRDTQVLSLTNDEEIGNVEQMHLDIDTDLIIDSKEAQNVIGKDPRNNEPTKEILTNIPNDRQDRNIGIEIGNNCPECKEGLIADIGGCNTCINCGIQWKCGL